VTADRWPRSALAVVAEARTGKKAAASCAPRWFRGDPAPGGDLLQERGGRGRETNRRYDCGSPANFGDASSPAVCKCYWPRQNQNDVMLRLLLLIAPGQCRVDYNG